MKDIKFEVMISTMNRTDTDFLRDMNLNSPAVVVNQSDGSKRINEKEENVRVINQSRFGLSHSRNTSLDNVHGEICLIADDDVIFNTGYQEKIIKAFEEDDADIITFQVRVNKDKNRYQKKFRGKEALLNRITIMKVTSSEIAFRRKKIVDNGIRFNEYFGAGSGIYTHGEENLFLNDCLKKGLKIKYLPIEIAHVDDDESTWFNGYNKSFFITKGALYTALSERLSLFYILQFVIRKRKIYIKEISMNKALKFMFEGRREFLNKRGS